MRTTAAAGDRSAPFSERLTVDGDRTLRQTIPMNDTALREATLPVFLHYRAGNGWRGFSTVFHVCTAFAILRHGGVDVGKGGSTGSTATPPAFTSRPAGPPPSARPA